jgi:hypothetical protein
MKDILSNLALIHASNFCKTNSIDCSGSHLYKYPRKFTYALLNTATGKALVTVTFHKSSVPTYSFTKN